MAVDLRKSFLTYYLQSLKERTSVEKGVVKNGLDWVAYSLGLALGYRPLRLPFFRNSGTELPTSKRGETEYGIDLSFITTDQKKLLIFVLKDERLTNSTWTANDFDSDLRRAIAPDLTAPLLKEVQDVEVILAYNKDDRSEGVTLFDHFVRTAPSKLGDHVGLTLTRWNLDRLVEQVGEHLMNPNLLPEKYFSLFSYICAQFGDFRHGSDEWENLLVPNWKAFLKEVLAERSGERAVLMLPVALLILREYGQNNASWETGLIDLTEWAVLEAWASAIESGDKLTLAAAQQLYGVFYLSGLERFYHTYGETISKEHVLDQGAGGWLGIAPTANAIKALWHTARVGLLAYGYFEHLAHETEEEKTERHRIVREWSNLMISLLNNSPGADRPVLDIHHIELFLIWRTLIQVGRKADLGRWLLDLEKNLYMRRIGQDELIFIHTGLQLEPVWEYLATGQRPPEFDDSSTTLVLMLMMFCASLPAEERNQLLLVYWNELVLAPVGRKRSKGEAAPLNLMAWHPPQDWGKRILREPVAEDGECIVIQFDDLATEPTGEKIALELQRFVEQVRANRDTSIPTELSRSLIVLACLKQRNPLPMELWCSHIYPVESN